MPESASHASWATGLELIDDAQRSGWCSIAGSTAGTRFDHSLELEPGEFRVVENELA
jgi:hypothetical protein